MIINLDYYKGQDLYCDGETEKDILRYEEMYEEKDFDKVFEKDIRWPIFYHMTPIRKNIINWYPFKEDAEVLEIGGGMGAITGALCDKAKYVTTVELSKQRAQSIANRCKNRDNLEIIVGNFNDIKFTKKFDYITLIGVLEYASLYTNTNNPFNDFLDKIKKLLKEDGKLLIAIENQFGMKYFSGCKEDHTAIKYDGIIGYKNKKGIRTFGKEELKQILQKSGFLNYKFYYPLPDYKLPLQIFSENYLPTEEKIEEYNTYFLNEQIEFDEKSAYKEVIKNNMFEFFANSFFIETSQMPINTSVNLEKCKFNEITQNEKNFYKSNKPITKTEINTDSEIETLKKELAEKQKIIDTIAKSKSWKITQPLRKISKFIRK